MPQPHLQLSPQPNAGFLWELRTLCRDPLVNTGIAPDFRGLGGWVDWAMEIGNPGTTYEDFWWYIIDRTTLTPAAGRQQSLHYMGNAPIELEDWGLPNLYSRSSGPQTTADFQLRNQFSTNLAWPHDSQFGHNDWQKEIYVNIPENKRSEDLFQIYSYSFAWLTREAGDPDPVPWFPPPIVEYMVLSAVYAYGELTNLNRAFPEADPNKVFTLREIIANDDPGYVFDPQPGMPQSEWGGGPGFFREMSTKIDVVDGKYHGYRLVGMGMGIVNNSLQLAPVLTGEPNPTPREEIPSWLTYEIKSCVDDASYPRNAEFDSSDFSKETFQLVTDVIPLCTDVVGYQEVDMPDYVNIGYREIKEQMAPIDCTGSISTLEIEFDPTEIPNLQALPLKVLVDVNLGDIKSFFNGRNEVRLRNHGRPNTHIPVETNTITLNSRHYLVLYFHSELSETEPTKFKLCVFPQDSTQTLRGVWPPSEYNQIFHSSYNVF